MTFEEYIEKEFNQNLELAIEEISINDDNDDMITRAWRYATEWTQEDIANKVGSYLDKKWSGRQEYINRSFYS